MNAPAVKRNAGMYSAKAESAARDLVQKTAGGRIDGDHIASAAQVAGVLPIDIRRALIDMGGRPSSSPGITMPNAPAPGATQAPSSTSYATPSVPAITAPPAPTPEQQADEAAAGIIAFLPGKRVRAAAADAPASDSNRASGSKPIACTAAEEQAAAAIAAFLPRHRGANS